MGMEDFVVLWVWGFCGVPVAALATDQVSVPCGVDA